jgi:hypothetical protein
MDVVALGGGLTLGFAVAAASSSGSSGSSSDAAAPSL